jgi:hypothetical protein
VPDDDLDALAQRLDLRLERAAAVDLDDADAAHAAGLLDVGGHLDGQLAGRANDERLRHAVGALGLARHALEQRHAEPSVLPVPVRAWPIRSWPASAIGSVIVWMAKGVVMPSFSSACTVSGSAPSAAKPFSAAVAGVVVMG